MLGEWRRAGGGYECDGVGGGIAFGPGYIVIPPDPFQINQQDTRPCLSTRTIGALDGPVLL